MPTAPAPASHPSVTTPQSWPSPPPAPKPPAVSQPPGPAVPRAVEPPKPTSSAPPTAQAGDGGRSRLLPAGIAAAVVLCAGGAFALTRGGDDDREPTQRAAAPAAEVTVAPTTEPETTVAPETEEPAALETLPDLPSEDSAQLAAEINLAQSIVDDPSSSDEDLAAAGRLQQLATRVLQQDASFRREAMSALEPNARAMMRTTLGASAALKGIVPPQKRFPKWRIVAPPSAERLLGYYQDAEAQTGVPWAYLAAIHLVETRMGRIRGDSTAGAQGPMQFIPETWARYGRGSVHSAKDSIAAAARLLLANGAPEDMSNALYHYNPSDGYVKAITRYARQMESDDRSFYAFHNWQVLYKHVRGTMILPEGYPAEKPVPIEE